MKPGLLVSHRLALEKDNCVRNTELSCIAKSSLIFSKQTRVETANYFQNEKEYFFSFFRDPQKIQMGKDGKSEQQEGAKYFLKSVFGYPKFLGTSLATSSN